MNKLVEKLGDAINQLAIAVKYSTRNNGIGQHWTNNGIDETIRLLTEAKAINLEQERFEDEPDKIESFVK